MAEPRNILEIPKEIADRFGRRVAVALSKGNRELAIAVVDLAFEEAVEIDGRLGLNSPVGDLLDVRTANLLHDAGLTTVRQLLSKTPQELVKIKNISWATVARIQQRCQEAVTKFQ